MNNFRFRIALYGLACLLCLLGIVYLTLYNRPRSTVANIIKRDYLRCGISDTHHFGRNFQSPAPDAALNPAKGPIFHRNAEGFEADFCRVVAVAIFGKEGHVRFAKIDANDRFALLQNGDIDILFRLSTCTGGREVKENVICGPVIYFDQTRFLVADPAIRNTQDLDRRKVCVLSDTTTEEIIQSEQYLPNIQITPVAVTKDDNTDESNALSNAFTNKRCIAIAGNVTRLLDIFGRLQSTDTDLSTKYTLIGDISINEPLTPYIKAGDEQWRKIVFYAVYSTIYASEQNITSSVIEECNDNVQQKIWFLGTDSVRNESFFGKEIGLERGFSCQIIRLIGNYDEIYERYLGKQELPPEFNLQRGPNQVWQPGTSGRLYSPPLIAP